MTPEEEAACQSAQVALAWANAKVSAATNDLNASSYDLKTADDAVTAAGIAVQSAQAEAQQAYTFYAQVQQLHPERADEAQVPYSAAQRRVGEAENAFHIAQSAHTSKQSAYNTAEAQLGYARSEEQSCQNRVSQTCR